MPEDYESTLAVMDAEEKYRYRLSRTWDQSNPESLTFIMLNPSTADGTTDDPTIRRCVGFGRRFGCGRINVVNLYAWRATKPQHLLLADDPVGPAADAEIERLLGNKDGGMVIAAWGATHRTKRLPNAAKRIERVTEIVEESGRQPYCLGFTKTGDPRHPLYLPKDAELKEWHTDWNKDYR